LLLRGSSYYAVVAVLIAAVWIAAIACALRRSRRAEGDRVAMRCVLLALAFVTVQGVFEPDYGSALRHLSPLIPLIAFAVGRAAVAAATPSALDEPGRHRA
jgi:4-amino-4-deoxy-L-arabinose transferase-like glycosyltransferase